MNNKYLPTLLCCGAEKKVKDHGRYKNNCHEKANGSYFYMSDPYIFWMDKILAAIREQPTFIMICTLHLPGEQWVIDL
ncbi:MAG: hypothetical protein AB2L24_21375 [Mangrovibacterium sp.]